MNITTELLVEALEKIAGKEYFYIGYINNSGDYNLSQRDEVYLAKLIMETITTADAGKKE